MTPGLPSNRRLVGGVVAFEDGERVARSIRSLLAQELPTGCEWTRIWVVISPDSMGTAAAARAAAGASPLVRVLEEPERRGKAAALAEIASRAEGDLLVLLNGDAEAAPGAVAELVHAAEGAGPVFGVMARPVTPSASGRVQEALDLLWRLHDRFHRELYRDPAASHMSDELFALPITALPPFRAGVITDGAFAGAWIRRQGGQLRYAENARVLIALPDRFRDHLEQRRRIRVGHRAVRSEFAVEPETIGSLLWARPGRLLRMLRAETRAAPAGVRSLMFLAVGELLALVLSSPIVTPRPEVDAVWARVRLAPSPRSAETGSPDRAG